MNLTQERINEIILECADKTDTTFDGPTPSNAYVIMLCNLFLSRIREEQKVAEYQTLVGGIKWVSCGKDDDELIISSGARETRKLFTIPPATPEKDCSELVEALKKYAGKDEWSGSPWKLQFNSSHLDGDGYVTAQEALAKHKAKMGEKL